MTQYQSLYRKWRPKSFEDVVGQNHITQTLKNAIKLNRIAHAYLFSGPRGVGKTTTARIFAKALNCQKSPTENPCNQCACCTRIDQGQSMDVLEIDGASNRGIDEIRELRSKIGFAPAEGKYKIYIIDEVHMLTDQAFNALLKTLEEPPGQVLFIFATTAPHKVPRTILSRCQVFYFRRITIEEIVEKLKRITVEEKLHIDLPSLHLIAESATGSMRDAESTLDQVIAYSENKITSEEVRDILGLVPHEIFRQLITAIIDKDTEGGLDLIGKLVKEGRELSQLVEDLLIYTHNLSLVKILGKDNSSSLSYFEVTEWEQIKELVRKSSITTILKIIEELRVIEERIRFHHYPWVLLELMVVKLIYSGTDVVSADSPVERVVNKKVLETKINKAKEIKIREEKEQAEEKVDKEEKEKKETLQKKEISTEDVIKWDADLEKLWSKVLARIKEKKISLHAFLIPGKNIRIEGNQLTIDFSKDYLFHKESLEEKKNKKIIESILKEEFNCEIELRCVLKENEAPEEPRFEPYKDMNNLPDNHTSFEQVAKEDSKENKQSEKSLVDNAILKKSLDLFGGKISEV